MTRLKGQAGSRCNFSVGIIKSRTAHFLAPLAFSTLLEKPSSYIRIFNLFSRVSHQLPVVSVAREVVALAVVPRDDLPPLRRLRAPPQVADALAANAVAPVVAQDGGADGRNFYCFFKKSPMDRFVLCFFL